VIESDAIRPPYTNPGTEVWYGCGVKTATVSSPSQ
jgi:hypothetical protein